MLFNIEHSLIGAQEGAESAETTELITTEVAEQTELQFMAQLTLLILWCNLSVWSSSDVR
jgi:hypothetical protein